MLTLVLGLEKASIIETRWVYQNKINKVGEVIRKKACLVSQGYSQKEGVDYNETFVPVALLEAIHILLSYVFFKGLIIFQIDVKSVLLNC